MKNTILRTFGYVTASFALFACGDADQVAEHMDELALGESTYTLSRACLSESSPLFEYCTGNEASDKKCISQLKTARDLCEVDASEARTEFSRTRIEREADAEEMRPQRVADTDETRPEPAADTDETRPGRAADAEGDRAERSSEDERISQARERDTDLTRRERGRDNEPRSERPQSCETACRAHAHEAFLDCVESGRDARDCRSYAAEIIEVCIEDRCISPTEPTVESTCEERCQSHGRDIYAECVDSGRRNVTCRAYATRVIQACIENRCEVEDTGSEQEEETNTCGHRARAVYSNCLDQGGAEARCSAYARRAHGACVDAQETEASEGSEGVVVEPRPDLTKPQKCLVRAKKMYAQCLENGGSRLRCSVLGDRLKRKCAKPAHVDADETQSEQESANEEVESGDADVEYACSERARAHHDRCIESRENPRVCANDARAIYERCAGMQSDDASAEEPTDGDVDLNRLCGERARHVYAGCIEDGGDARRCGALDHRALDACVEANQN